MIVGMVCTAIRVLDTTALVDYLADLLLEDLLSDSAVAAQPASVDNENHASSRDLRSVFDRQTT